MNLYDCRVGDVVITGDSYGMSPCVCVAEKHMSDEYPFEVVTFLDLTNGVEYNSGGVGMVSLDECMRVDKISQNVVDRIKRAWKLI